MKYFITQFGTSPHEKLSTCFPDSRPFEKYDNPDPNASEQWKKWNAHESSVTSLPISYYWPRPTNPIMTLK